MTYEELVKTRNISPTHDDPTHAGQAPADQIRGDQTHGDQIRGEKADFSIPINYEIDTPPNLTPPRIECYLDEGHSIRHMAYIGTIHHDQLILKILNIWSQIPDLGRYDNLIDMRFHKGDVGWHTVKVIGREWNLHFAGNAPKKHTAFVSNHTSFTVLIKAIQAFSPQHVFQGFSNRDKALTWLKTKS
mgnify:CR=1 FL=1